uniref:Inner membrane protein n=3 Tax=unclassified Prevotella TaxID=2638335 RepID=A0AB33JPN2_9BACT
MGDQELLLLLAVACMVMIGVTGKAFGRHCYIAHAIIFLCYTCALVYGMIEHGAYGTSLLWFVLLASAYLLHILLMSFLLIRKAWLNRKR